MFVFHFVHWLIRILVLSYLPSSIQIISIRPLSLERKRHTFANMPERELYGRHYDGHGRQAMLQNKEETFGMTWYRVIVSYQRRSGFQFGIGIDSVPRILDYRDV